MVAGRVAVAPGEGALGAAEKGALAAGGCVQVPVCVLSRYGYTPSRDYDARKGRLTAPPMLWNVCGSQTSWKGRSPARLLPKLPTWGAGARVVVATAVVGTVGVVAAATVMVAGAGAERATAVVAAEVRVTAAAACIM